MWQTVRICYISLLALLCVVEAGLDRRVGIYFTSKMEVFFLCCLLQLWSTVCSNSNVLTSIAGEQLKSHLPETGTTLALFTRSSGCATCAGAAEQVRSVIGSLPMPVSAYLLADSAVTAKYADRVPALVMFHGHTPVLYEGPMEADAFADFITANREPRVVVLNDESFEHLTQASTGATTGDWLAMFHGLSCDGCEALESRLQGIATKLKNRVMVAKLCSQTDGRGTATRFGIDPTKLQILLFRQGQMYTYTSEKLDLTSLSAFAVGLYKDAPSQPVPALPQGPLMLILQIVGALLLLGYVLATLFSRQKHQQQKKGF